MFVPRIHSDGRGYYAYLRSTVIDQDLDFTNEFYQLTDDPRGLPPKEDKTATGLTQNPWSIGPAFMLIPFFAIAHFATYLVNLAGHGLPMNGYSIIYVLTASLGAAFYAFTGILLVYDICVRYFHLSSRATFWSVIIIWFASPLTMYIYREPMMVHAFSFFTVSLFLYVFFFYFTNMEGVAAWVVLGVALGLMLLVRWSNITLLTLPIAYTIAKCRRFRNLHCVKYYLLHWSLCLGVAAIIFLPQAIAWRMIYGQFLLVPHDLLLPAGHHYMNWASPRFWDVLFSSRHGFFSWTPAMLLSFLGFFFWIRNDRLISMSLFAAFVLQIYLNGAADDWYGGAAFGYRRLIEILPVLAISLGFMLERFSSKRIFICAASIVFVTWNFLFLIQYNRLLIPAMDDLTIQQIVFDKFTLPTREIMLFFFAKYLKEVPDTLGSFASQGWVSIGGRVLGLTSLSAMIAFVSEWLFQRLRKLGPQQSS